MNFWKTLRAACALACFVFVSSAFAGLGDVCHWTGNGGDAYWTNANNWAEGRVPGRWYAPDGVNTNGAVGEVAIFGDDLVDGGATNIDFSGVHSISNLITTGTEHRYVYGTSASQYVPIEGWGRFTVAELPNTPVARLPARLRAGAYILAATWDGTKWNSTYGKETVKVRNNSATEEFVFENTWGHCTRDPRHPSGGGQTGFQVEGTGSFRFSAMNSGNTPFFRDCLTTGKLVIDTKFAMRAFEVNAPGEGLPADSTTVRQIELTANGVLASSEGNQTNFETYRPTRIYGDGYLAFTAGWTGGGTYWLCSGFYVSAETTVECVTKFHISSAKTTANWTALANYPYRMVVTGSANNKLHLKGGTTVGQEVVLSDWTTLPDPASAFALRQHSGYSRVLCAETFAEDGPFGPGAFELTAGSSVWHEGAEDSTMTRAIVVTNLSTAAKAARLKQAGEGAWTVTSPVTAAASVDAATLYLSGEGAGTAIFTGTVDAKTAVACESGNWTFAPSDGQCARLTPAGGQMRMGTGSYTIGEIATAANGSTIIVPNGCTLNVGKLAADKTLDIVLLGETALVTVDPEAANVVTGLKMNGHAAILDADGHLQLAVGSANVWKLPVDGSWTDTAKWAGNLAVDPLKETFIDMPGGDFAVTVDGVEQTVTNLYLGSMGGETVKLVLTNGTHLTVEGRTHIQSVLNLKPGARVEAYDSELELFNRGNANGESGSTSTLKLGGGSLALHGTSQLKDHGIPKSLRTSGTGNLNGHLYFGTGSVDFYDDSTFTTEYENGSTVFYHYYRADNPGETSRVTFHDRAHFAFPGNPYQCFIGGNHGHAILECDSSSKSNLRMYYQAFVGLGSGVGEMILKGAGEYYMGGNFMQVGTPQASDQYATTTAFTTGRVEVADSAFCMVYSNDSNTPGFGGFSVGQGLTLDKDRGASFLHGEVLVKDAGHLAQERGSFVVGGGPNGDGEVTMTGGKITLIYYPNLEDSVPGAMLVGGFGGNGRYSQTDGTFLARRRVFIGGATTNEMFRCHKNGARLLQFHDAQGSVSVRGGSFTTTHDIVLGRDGTGTLELSGTGTVAAVAIVVSNTVGQAASALKFTADAHGRCGTLDPATALTFHPGAKLVVDVSACPDKGVRVFNLDAAPVGLTAEMIELVGDGDVKYPHRLEASPDFRRLTYVVERGMRLILR